MTFSSQSIAIVTGASRGIGKAIALKLGSMGASVIGTATTEQGSENISAYMKEAGIVGEGRCLQVQDVESITGFVKSVTSDWAAPTVLVNNAGITRDDLLMRMKADDWQSVIDTNLNAVFHLSKACIKGMTKARWGRIINVSSVVGQMGNAGQVNYAASKAGVEGFSRALAKEVGVRNITVNCIAPGFIETDMTADLNEDHKEAMLKQVSVGRLG
ncbi:MAG: 3-oxoacyl-ACP reductase FabG, partial [Pseudomonadota bacterium]